MVPVPSSVMRAIPHETLTKLSIQRPTRVSLSHIYTVGRHVLDSSSQKKYIIPAQFLHAELPIRLSQTLKILHSPLVPQEFSILPTFKKFTRQYYDYISILMGIPKPENETREEEYTKILRLLKKEHRTNLVTLRQAFREIRDLNGIEKIKHLDTEEIRELWDRFYAITLGTRLLIAQHLALHDEKKNLVTRISPKDVAERAIRDTRNYCEKLYNHPVPEIQLFTTDPTATTIHIEEHLHSILCELLRNSISTTIRHHSPEFSHYDPLSSIHSQSRGSLFSSLLASSSPTQSSKPNPSLPPISILIAQGAQDITIKISDHGGGMPMSVVDDAWSYFVYDDESQSEADVERSERPFDCGVGASLPFARVTARYFGGDLSFVSMEGHGTDTFLSLYRDDTCLEAFPESHASLDDSLLLLEAA
ncbi:10561_t:CDS:2 [Paraglomus occultum]|uniref:Protein-serine/threonine kinase n=1 Tax=Paraglomus occultum TaxID=144539 RepID=A0A9N9F2R6_9GLOM|nr:10561_t:CDS:2 [Paraglomus occultum]